MPPVPQYGRSFSLHSLLLFVTVVGVALGGVTCLDRWRRNWDVASRDHWPQELRQLACEARAGGDNMADVEVRYGGSIVSYYWKMAATETRLNEHVRQFKLQAVQPGGVEEFALRQWFPDAWRPPSDQLDVYAFPPGSAKPPEGEYLFVLLHDKKQQLLYFHYDFDF